MAVINTQNGYALDEVVSALQKSIRRGLEREALYWAWEMYNSSYSEYLFKRLFIICTEDIGIAEPDLPAQLWALYQMHLHVKKKGSADASLFAAQAVIMLARAKKSRLVTCGWYVVRTAKERLQIPDYALDQHTARGRSKGRNWKTKEGVDFWLEEGEKLVDEAEDVPNIYYEESVDLFYRECLQGDGPTEEFSPTLFDTGVFEKPKF